MATRSNKTIKLGKGKANAYVNRVLCDPRGDFTGISIEEDGPCPAVVTLTPSEFRSLMEDGAQLLGDLKGNV